MPNCFQLTRRSNPEAGPVPLVKIDEEMCQHFKHPCHPTKWFHEWYDVIGFRLAMGRFFEELILEEQKADDNAEVAGQHEDAVWHREMIDIIEWLAKHFSSDCWAQIGK